MLDKSTYREFKKKILREDNHEEMVALGDDFLKFSPHPYLSKNAPYKNISPFYVREDVHRRLSLAAKYLDDIKKGYRLKIFDAYRPLEVQEFMINYDKERISQEKYQTAFVKLNAEQEKEVTKVVETFWSPMGKETVLNPPPHATGGALDLTIVDENGKELEMGTEIDELNERSYSDYYKDSPHLTYEKNRKLLYTVMSHTGFTQLPTEWWHFSYGDQIWVVDRSQKEGVVVKAIYGMI